MSYKKFLEKVVLEFRGGVATVLDISPKPLMNLHKLTHGRSAVTNFRRRHSNLIKKCSTGSGKSRLTTILSATDGQSLANDWVIVGNDLRSGIAIFEQVTMTNERANTELTGTG